jgi:ATP-dependent RNA circularization protein (DNA/RNA ligase family)
MHLPWSPGLQRDDRIIESLDGLDGQEVIVTEKLDGENTSMYRDTIHARSIDGRYHVSRDWVKSPWAQTCMSRLSPGSRICGENVFAQHSIKYDDLETYFYGFSYWDSDKCFSWDHTLTLFDHFGITPVKTLWRGMFSETAMHEIESQLDLDRQEGYVVRRADNFEMQNFPNVVAKYVRKGMFKLTRIGCMGKLLPTSLQNSRVNTKAIPNDNNTSISISCI